MARPEQAIPAAELDAQIIDLKKAGHTFQAIADQLGYSKPYMYRCYQRALLAIRAPSVEEYRTAQLARIQAEREVVTEVMETRHLVVSNGHIVSEIVGTQPATIDGEPNALAGQPIYGDPLVDDSPVLAAVDRLIKLDAQESDLLGLKAPTRVETEMSGGLRYEVVGVPVEGLT